MCWAPACFSDWAPQRSLGTNVSFHLSTFTSSTCKWRQAVTSGDKQSLKIHGLCLWRLSSRSVHTISPPRYDKMLWPDKSNWREQGFILTHGLRVKSIIAEKIKKGRLGGGWWHCSHGRKGEGKVPVLSSLLSETPGQDYPHLEWVFPPQLTQSRNLPQMCLADRGMFPW